MDIKTYASKLARNLTGKYTRRLRSQERKHYRLKKTNADIRDKDLPFGKLLESKIPNRSVFDTSFAFTYDSIRSEFLLTDLSRFKL